MTELTLTKEQLSSLKDADSPVRVLDELGRIIGYLHPERDEPIVLTQEQVDKIARRLADDESHYITTAELLQRIADSSARNGARGRAARYAGMKPSSTIWQMFGSKYQTGIL
jgi:hypothetical protein